MSWKIENWSKEIRPAVKAYGETYSQLGFRELVTVACSDLDHALAELLSKRLCGPAKEIEQFLGADGDGRAPCGSFGSRIQLALLLDIITVNDAELLRRLKSLRNIVAHRVNARYAHPAVQAALLKLLRAFITWMFALSDTPYLETKQEEIRLAKKMKQLRAGKGLVMKVIGLFHLRFTCTLENMTPVQAVPELTRIGRKSPKA